ncbi:hypothetical protein [Streptomyces coelicoflavus]|uniref:Uncharacterized protein n=1 Tax=Streptomyces coelicoflavus TaxID=285562 RepID=A0A7K3PR26_9ACTN|nr:hypothetical protein [Streptomyces coelicoflavus]NEB12412.1 hypothetical protein [Streptomyces coelicoflavus]
MRDRTDDPLCSSTHPTARSTARSAVAVSVAALITAAALFGALAPKAAALEGPLINDISIALQ